jgi:cell division protein FtsW
MKRSLPVQTQIFYTVLALLVLGLIIIYSTSTVYSTSVFDDPYRILKNQFAWVTLGLLGFLTFYNLKFKQIKLFGYFGFILSLCLLLFLGLIGLARSLGLFSCDVISIAPCINGATRWLRLFGVSFQPVELTKLTLVLYLSFQFQKFLDSNLENLFTVYIVTTLIVCFLLILQPNMSSALLIFMIATAVYFVSGDSLYRLLKLVPLAFILILTLMVSSDYRRDRVLTFLNFTSSQEHSNQSAADYHSEQALIALGSGGWTGLGLGNSKQKYSYLPEISTDSIFAVVGEELGYVGSLLLLSAFYYFFYLTITVAKDSKNITHKMIVVGLITWIVLQTSINIGALLKLIPFTGMPLPFISYGGSSLIFILISCGIICNVAKHNMVK